MDMGKETLLGLFYLIYWVKRLHVNVYTVQKNRKAPRITQKKQIYKTFFHCGPLKVLNNEVAHNQKLLDLHVHVDLDLSSLVNYKN